MTTKAILSLGISAAVLGSVFVLSPVPVRTQGRGQPVQLPDGPGKEVVQTTCTQVPRPQPDHQLLGRPRQAGRHTFGTMVALPADQKAVISGYLATHFPVKPAPAAVLIPGRVQVSIKEWVVPTLGSRPHDPLAAPTARSGGPGSSPTCWAGSIRKTGAMKEFPLKTPKSGPHGLVDGQGREHLVHGNQQARTSASSIRRPGESPSTRCTAQGARGPHTPIFDQKGTLWFTMQSGHVGRLIPSTGEMKVVATPTPRTPIPTASRSNSKGVPWYVDFRGNRVGSVDPETMEIKEYTLPNPERVRGASRSPPTTSSGTPTSARLSGPLRSDDRPGEGMAVARRPGVAAVRHCRRSAASSGTASPPSGRTRWCASTRDREIPDLGDPVGRRRRAQHDADRDGNSGDGRQRREPRRARRDQVDRRPGSSRRGRRASSAAVIWPA